MVLVTCWRVQVLSETEKDSQTSQDNAKRQLLSVTVPSWPKVSYSFLDMKR